MIATPGIGSLCNGFFGPTSFRPEEVVGFSCSKVIGPWTWDEACVCGTLHASYACDCGEGAKRFRPPCFFLGEEGCIFGPTWSLTVTLVVVDDDDDDDDEYYYYHCSSFSYSFFAWLTIFCWFFSLKILGSRGRVDTMSETSSRVLWLIENCFEMHLQCLMDLGHRLGFSRYIGYGMMSSFECVGTVHRKDCLTFSCSVQRDWELW